MGAFDFVFSLFGLLLGLSLAELITGLSRALKLRSKVRIGWLTPLFAVFVIMDLTSFWLGAWELRSVVRVTYAMLILGVLTSGLYYFAASLVFPDDPAEWPDFDGYYFRHRRQVFAAVFTCNLIAFVIPTLVGALPFTVTWAVLTGVYVGGIAIAALTRNRTANLAVLVVLIGVYASYTFLE